MTDDIYSGNTIPDDERESVDDILAEILNNDGSFNRDFSSRFSAYLGEDASEYASAVSYDLSDRRGENAARHRVEYESPEYIKPHIKEDEYDRTERRLEEKLPESVRNAYYNAEGDAMRPEFTAAGGVKYPSMGTGASEQRVVFDADWEERARKEAARMQRVREDRMLRGDSAYMRSFVASGRSFEESYVPSSPYVDPLSDDDDIYSPEFQRGAVNNPNPFFHSGPAVRRNNTTADGRTDDYNGRGTQQGTDDRVFDSFASSYDKAKAAQSSWLTVEDKTTKKKNKNKKSKRKEKYIDDEPQPENIRHKEQREEHIEPLKLTDAPRERYFTEENSTGTLTQPGRRRKVKAGAEPVAEAMHQAQTETEDLKNTVAGIVEKYNKRSEEDKIAMIKAAAERKIREEERIAERARVRKGLSEGLITALDSEEASPEQFTGYDDFSEEKKVYIAPMIGAGEKKKKKKNEEDYIERLEESSSAAIEDGFSFNDDYYTEEKEPEAPVKEKKKRKKKR